MSAEEEGHHLYIPLYGTRKMISLSPDSLEAKQLNLYHVPPLKIEYIADKVHDMRFAGREECIIFLAESTERVWLWRSSPLICHNRAG